MTIPCSELEQDYPTRLMQLIERFEEAWRREPRPVLDDFLPANPAERRAALIELVLIDLERRLKASEDIRVETYLQRYPELAENRQVVLDLIAAEFNQRRRREAGLDAGEYADRFPEFHSDLPRCVSPVEGTIPTGTAESASLEIGKPGLAPTGLVTSESAGAELASLGLALAPPQFADELGRLGGYRVLKVLGAGGMGIVLQAEDPQLHRLVALKAMRPAIAASANASRRFLREAQAAAAIKHDRIVTIYQVGEDGGVPFLAMELLEGETLQQRLRREDKLAIPEVLHIGREIAEGLAAAHERGLIHRDIKPSNLWLENVPGGRRVSTPRCRVKILDFGLARVASGEPNLTPEGTILGTPLYMAPEQATGQPVDSSCDLFSLGAVLYQMSMGQPPFGGDNTLVVLAALARDTPISPDVVNPAVPSPLAALIMQLLHKDRASRPASAREVADRLHDMEHQPDVPEATAPTRPARRRYRRWGLIAATVVLLLLLPLAHFFGGQVIRLATNQGEIVIEVNDPSVEIVIKQHGVVVQDRTTQREFVLTAGDGQVEAYEKASGLQLATRRFTLTRGGKETVTVRLDPKPAATPTQQEIADADRRAAIWVLRNGGDVDIHVVGKAGRKIQAVNDLPTEPFQVVSIGFQNQDFTDAALEQFAEAIPKQFKGLRNVTDFRMANTGVSDEGLKHLQALPHLTYLWLTAPKLSNNGLKHLQVLPNLKTLILYGTPIGDDGLAYLKELRKLQFLSLAATRAGDHALTHLKVLPNLKQLDLQFTVVGNKGLEQVKEIPNLEDLRLNRTAVGNEALAHLKALPNLRALSLWETTVDDAGLRHLYGMKSLRELYIGTNVPAESLAALQKELPECRIIPGPP